MHEKKSVKCTLRYSYVESHSLGFFVFNPSSLVWAFLHLHLFRYHFVAIRRLLLEELVGKDSKRSARCLARGHRLLADCGSVELLRYSSQVDPSLCECGVVHLDNLSLPSGEQKDCCVCLNNYLQSMRPISGSYSKRMVTAWCIRLYFGYRAKSKLVLVIFVPTDWFRTDVRYQLTIEFIREVVLCGSCDIESCPKQLL